MLIYNHFHKKSDNKNIAAFVPSDFVYFLQALNLLISPFVEAS